MPVSAFLAGWQRCISGCGFAHFYHYGPIKLEYTIDRFTMEAKRQLHVLDQRLAGSSFIPGKDYSVADIASFPSVGQHLTQRNSSAPTNTATFCGGRKVSWNAQQCSGVVG